jgi:uncharacterized membrane protein
MEPVIGFFVLFVLAVLIVPFVLSITHASRLRAIESTLKKLTERLKVLESGAREGGLPSAKETTPVPPPIPAPAVAARFSPPPKPALAPGSVPPPLPIPAPRLPSVAPPPPPPLRPAIDWEAFMGVKLFAWIGGFVLFLGVVFLVKYSFENNLITPRMRIAIGTLIGLSLIAAGWRAAGKNYRVPGQSLCATGVLVLYANIFAAHAFYNLISLTPAFVAMSCVTIAAFFLAVTLKAQVVVILGLLGGFLTPVLLSTGEDRPAALFGYIALLNIGVAAVVLRKRWDYLVLLSAIGTVLMEFMWAAKFFDVSTETVAFVVFIGFELLFLAIFFLRRKTAGAGSWTTAAAALSGFAALGFAFWMLSYRQLAVQPAILFSFVFLVDIGLLTLATARLKPALSASASGIAVFAFFACWTGEYLADSLLWWALGAYLLFAVLHTGFAVWPKSALPESAAIRWESFVPLFSLVLIWLCVSRNETSPAVWLCVLLIDLVAVGLALTTSSIRSLAIALFCTVIAAALWIGTAPSDIDDLNGFLGVTAGFGVFFFFAAMFLARRFAKSSEGANRNIPGLAAILPFLLLLMVIAKLPVANPMLVFGAAFLFAILLLGLGIVSGTDWVAAIALAGAWVVERTWQTLHYSPLDATIPLGWYVVFALLFIGYPFFATRKEESVPWAASSVSGALHFWLIFEIASSAYPLLRNGLLPVAFILPYAFGTFYLIRKRGIKPASGDAKLAWQGGAALLFISLIFPIQFDREWITLGWALEGFALIWFFRKVPHRGLRIVGSALLCVAFIRLALNPAVLTYHRRAPHRIWNWYLYAYGITSCCLILAARLFQPREEVVERAAPPVLYSLGAILVFLLLNIEIADYFSIGPTLTFSFSGNFARDMSYSIAWALFAFALLLVGMRQKSGAVRYAGLGLLLVTLAKLFLHDLGNLGQLYRIGAFIGVAMILIVISFVYQRFLVPKAGKS